MYSEAKPMELLSSPHVGWRPSRNQLSDYLSDDEQSVPTESALVGDLFHTFCLSLRECFFEGFFLLRKDSSKKHEEGFFFFTELLLNY